MPSQAVFDLLWTINSASFVTVDSADTPGSLSLDQIDGDALDTFLGDNRPHRVGRYFEQLVHFWLVHVRGVDMLGAGLQIRDGKRTIGELDFVYRDEAGIVVHCEVAVKFFLHHRRHGHSHFPGPNASDSFEAKTNKMFDQQLELSREHFPQVQRRQAFMKGMCFYGSTRPQALPPRMNPDHGSGTWIYSQSLDQLSDHHAAAGLIVQKPHWLAPVVDAQLREMSLLLGDLRAHFVSDRPHPVMLSLRDGESLQEVDRVFVMPAHWPNRDL